MEITIQSIAETTSPVGLAADEDNPAEADLATCWGGSIETCHPAAAEVSDEDDLTAIDIDLSKLPPGTKFVRIAIGA